MTTTDLTLRDKVKALMMARDEATLAQAAYKEARDTWEAEVGSHLQETMQLTRVMANGLEMEVRDLALVEYRRTNNKNPTPGVEIKISKVVGFSSDEAEEWSLLHEMARIPSCLDEKEYRNLVLNGHAPGTVQEEPVAQIARDLAKALKAEQ